MASILVNSLSRRVADLLTFLSLAGLSICRAQQNSAQAQSDTSRPLLPVRANLPNDSTFTVEGPNLPRATGLFYRNVVGIIFDDTTSGTTIRGVLTRYAGTIIGGSRGDKEYIVRIPDPGPTFAGLESVVAHLSAEGGVALARKIYYRTPISIEGHPNE